MPLRVEDSIQRAESIVSILCNNRDAIFSRRLALFEGASEKLREASRGPGPFARRHEATVDRLHKLQVFQDRLAHRDAHNASSGGEVVSTFRRAMDENWASVAKSMGTASELEETLAAYQSAAQDFVSVLKGKNIRRGASSSDSDPEQGDSRRRGAFDVGGLCQRAEILLEQRSNLLSSIKAIESCTAALEENGFAVENQIILR